MQAFCAGCRRAHSRHSQHDSPVTWQSFIRQLAGHHSGYEALLQPLLGPMPSAELLHKQCQLALKAPKVLTLSSQALNWNEAVVSATSSSACLSSQGRAGFGIRCVCSSPPALCQLHKQLYEALEQRAY